ncbi:hypothetical protein Leryth_009060 [Lithospermum erythrorhizon]|nr:hypothetical protein Leryth_009060 [Lithospermum erythrorhizon]
MKRFRLSPSPTPHIPPSSPSTTREFNAIINHLSSQRDSHKVLKVFISMLKSTPSTPPDAFTYPSILKACASLNLYSLGLSLHQQITVNGYFSDSFTSSSLVSFYARFGQTCNARKVFDIMPERNIVPWTTIIGCYSRSGDLGCAVSLYNEMVFEGVRPSDVTVVALLSRVMDVVQLLCLHACVIKYGFLLSSLSLMNCLISVYGKCGRVDDGRKLFDSMEIKDIVSWNSLIAGYGLDTNVGEMWRAFCRMRVEGVEPDQQTYTSLLPAIAKERCFEFGKIVHGQMLVSGLELGVHGETALLGLYLKCGNVDDAYRIFEKARNKDMILWMSMVSGLVKNERADRALEVFSWMLSSGVMPSATILAATLAACAQLNSLRFGSSIYCFVLRHQIHVDAPFQNSLVSMYAKCGKLERSFIIFDMIEEKDVVSWNAIVTGCAQNDQLDTAICLFNEMRIASVKPDSVTVASLLQACAFSGAFHQGKTIHTFVIRSCLAPCIIVDTALVDMYCKCGNLEIAMKCFYRMEQHDLISWSTIIAGYGSHGEGEAALKMFSKFLQSGIKPNSVIFLSVLYSCNHNGLIQQGLDLFDSMINVYGIKPELEHLACMVDLLCRAGRVVDAHSFYRRLFPEPNIDVLGILLDASRTSRNIELVDIVSHEISLLRPEDPGRFVQLAHTYASMANWGGVGEAWMQLRSLGLKKVPGWSFIDLQGQITTFFVGQCSHSRCEDIVSILKSLSKETRQLVSHSNVGDDGLIMDPGI